MINLVISQYTARGLNTILRQQFGMYKHGRSRKVYIDRKSNVVYKLPITSNHNGYNIQEYNNFLAYKKGIKDIPVADCMLHYTSDNVPIVVMEYVTDYIKIHKTWKGIPLWARLGAVDTYQIGYTVDGRLVAYDHTHGID